MDFVQQKALDRHHFVMSSETATIFHCCNCRTLASREHESDAYDIMFGRVTLHKTSLGCTPDAKHTNAEVGG